MNAYYLNQFISTTLSTAGGIDDSQTTGIKIASTSGITTDKPGILCLSYSSSIDTTKVEWITYTSIDISNELQGVTRGAEGFSAKAHANGVTVAFPISKSHINNLNDALIIGGDETNLLEGVLDEDDMASDSATKGATQQSIKAYVDTPRVVALTDGATPALDASLGNIFTLSAGGNRTIAVPSNPTSGQKIIIIHHANGAARTLALNTGAGGFAYGEDVTALTATTSGKRDYIGCVYNATSEKWHVVAVSKGY